MLFLTMLALAAVPGVSVLTVVSRATTLGVRHGVYATLGIVTGDVIFISVAVFGLAAVANQLGDAFVYVKIACGLYLIWLGIKLYGLKPSNAEASENQRTATASSFGAGLAVTLGDQKAILFYLGFLPAFIDLTSMTALHYSLLIAIAAVAIFCAKLFYVLLAFKASAFWQGPQSNLFARVAGILTIAVGIWVMF